MTRDGEHGQEQVLGAGGRGHGRGAGDGSGAGKPGRAPLVLRPAGRAGNWHLPGSGGRAVIDVPLRPAPGGRPVVLRLDISDAELLHASLCERLGPYPAARAQEGEGGVPGCREAPSGPVRLRRGLRGDRP
ncbi:hypothetical protein [Streptomyces sp. ST2-7A]|uniref:hypothetical protein n=1 Tax=Streptomyces sp. ST2-7A TaxID=2907214 RepID=UPI001F2FF947|nr:hypothetical protein [Streptomyces sp. ST2-7A]MCE7081126.1 hypothetical protein [Streptomyces sp. ST2-7A]